MERRRTESFRKVRSTMKSRFKIRCNSRQAVSGYEEGVPNSVTPLRYNCAALVLRGQIAATPF
eukprot:416225-Rhodomonas_salina.1